MNGRAFTQLQGIPESEPYNDDKLKQFKLSKKNIIPSRSQTDIGMYNGPIAAEISIEKIRSRDNKTKAKPPAMDRHNSVAEFNNFSSINMEKADNAAK